MTSRHASRVFHNGRVFRADAARSWAAAVAVAGERIAAVGGWSDVSGLIGPDTEVTDLDGRYLGPGFQDAHVHPHTGGRRMLTCDLTNCGDAAAALDEVAAYSAAHRDAAWIHGGGWRFAWFEGGMPSAEVLDRVVPDRPVYLRVADGHAGWANSAALAAAGIDAATPEPRFGRIERLTDGRPQGTLQEEGAMALVERLLPKESDRDMAAAILVAQHHLFSLGVTAWQDAAVGERLHRTYLALGGDGRLKAAVRGAQWWEPDHGIEQLEALATRGGDAAGTYYSGAVKLMLDGVCENFTARTLTPYLDGAGHPTTNHGMDYIDPDALPGIVTAVMGRGLQPHFHALADAAVRHALDAVAAGRTSLGWSDVRPHIAHLQIVHPDDLPRFRALGVVANAQALWACADAAMIELNIPFLGEPRVSWQYPFAGLLRAGATMAMGSDWSVTTADPLAQIAVAVDRRVPDDPESSPFLPEQAIGLADALVAFTAGSAFVNHREADTGTIRAGSRADLVILNGDPFAIPIATLHVDETIVAGEAVFRR